MSKQTWICDACGEAITSTDQGWIEWLTRRDGAKTSSRGLRLVHHGRGCQYDQHAEHRRDGSTISDQPLREFIGSDGLLYLLELIELGQVTREQGFEMIKRLHVPGYDRTFRHFKSAIAEGVFEPARTGFFSTSDIEATLEWLEQRDE